MTLLEAVVALVILGVAGVASLGVVETASRGTHDSEVWTQTVAAAEAAMEASKLPAPAREPTTRAVSVPGTVARVERRPWGSVPGLEEVTVTVALPGGGEFQLKRLERIK